LQADSPRNLKSWFANRTARGAILPFSPVGSASEFNLEFDYFQLSASDPGEPIRTLLFILDTHFGILQVFENVLNGVVAHDPSKWAVQRNIGDGKLAIHKAKWRSVAEVSLKQPEMP
jgi:hypothetical protein